MLVLCETCLPTGEPIPSNSRAKARAAFEAAPGLVPWFGIEQEYTLFDKDMVGTSLELSQHPLLNISVIQARTLLSAEPWYWKGNFKTPICRYYNRSTIYYCTCRHLFYFTLSVERAERPIVT